MANHEEVSAPGGSGVDITDKALTAIERIAAVSKKSGVRNTTLAAGIVILLFTLLVPVAAGIELVNSAILVLGGLVVGGTLIFAVLVTSSFDYRANLEAELRRQEIEAKLRIAHIEAASREGRSLPPQPE